MDKRENIIQELEKLVLEKGYIYSLSSILLKDSFFNPKDILDIDWYKQISFQEASLIIGLMIKKPISLEIPQKSIINDQIKKTYEIINKLHESFTAPFVEGISSIVLEQQEGKLSEDQYDKRFKDLFGSGEMLSEPLFYASSGVYDFQYLEIAAKRYRIDDEWIKTNKGLSIDEIVGIASEIKKIVEIRASKIKSSQKAFPDFIKSIFLLFCFNLEDIQLYSKHSIKKFMDIFSVAPGNINELFNNIGAYNIFDSHPIIKLDTELYYVPIYFVLTQSIYESPFYWMIRDNQYKEKSLKNRGEATENIVYELLENIFKEKIYKRVEIKKGKKQKITDIDVLAFQGNKALVVQAKSKKLTELSKQGDDTQLREDFEKAIQDAYTQALKCRNAILDKSNILIDENLNRIKLDESIDDVYIICVTTDNYPVVTHQIDVYLNKDKNDPYPVAVSIFDLELMAFYLNDPFEFLYYMRQRIALTGYFKALSEMVFLSYHLNNKLFPNPRATGAAIDSSMASLIDANFPAMKGYQPITKATNKLHHKWKNKKFDELVEQVKKSKVSGLTDAVFFLYDIAGESADKIIELIDKTKTKAKNDQKEHDWTMIMDNGKSGVSFMCKHENSKYLLDHLLYFANARKYKTKADTWLGLGCIVNSSQPIDSVVFSKDKWKYNSEMEELSKKALKKGQLISYEKVGRNDPCPCGSGIKYKFCCGK